MLLIVVSPRIYWSLKEKTPLNVLIIDKTVPNSDYREHQGLMWLLTNEKVTKADGTLYDQHEDYFGYDPLEQKSRRAYAHTVERDFIYVADTYGVYTDDLADYPQAERSEQLYGGMALAEWKEIMKTKTADNVLVAEYNAFATPTSKAVRTQMEKDLHVKWSGWIGRYFYDLTSEEVPKWLVDGYEAQHGERWPFKKGGLAFVHESNQIVVIDEEQLQSLVMVSTTAKGAKAFGELTTSHYAYWFDIVEPVGSVVLANYIIDVDEAAANLLAEHQIPTTFPAVTWHERDNIYYFSGDYADYTKDNLMKWQKSGVLMRMFSNEESDFMWTVYIPMMRQILNQLK